MSQQFPGEVVTRALVRFLDVPGVSGEVALVTLDNGCDHTRPSTFGPAGLASLDAALDAIEARRPRVAAIAVTGKPFVFAVGADLGGVALIRDRSQAVELGRTGHRVFRRLADSAVPTFAFINGAALGGGLELALHCHYRSLAARAATVAFPEVFLGLVPGWGGTQLLPRLIGPRAAITVIVENALSQNRMLKPAEAAALGVVDVVLDDADFLAESLRWAGKVLDGSTPVDRVSHVDDDWDGAVAAGRAFADMRTGGTAPAAYRALDLVALARTAAPSAGAAAEDDALGELIMSDELRAGLYAFDLVQKRAKRPVGAPDRSLARSPGKVGIIGAGLMAGQLAVLFVQRLEVPVVLTDLDQERLDRGIGYVRGEIGTLLAKGRISRDRANRLTALVTGSLGMRGFADADLVIEAVFEELAVKKQVLAEAERHVGPETVLATNTSSLSVAATAAGLQHPERVVGLHFFNPVALMPLLEIVRAERTDEATLATAFAVAAALKKTAILVADTPSFVVNRLLGRFMGEMSRIVDEGTPLDVADGAVAGLAPMPPFVLLALVGPAIALHNAQSLHEGFGDRFYVSENLRGIVAANKTALYVWDAGKPEIDPEIAAFFRVADPPVVLDAAQVRERVLSALADEARRMLDEAVVSAAQDIDLAMITGAGFSFWNGGLTPLLDRSGVAERAAGGRFLPPGVASVSD